MAKQTFSGNLRASPPWLKDFGGREHILAIPAKIDPAQFTDQLGVVVTTSGAAAQNATSVPVTALTPNSVLANTILIAQGNVLIPAGTTLYFGGAKVATLTADAIIGDTALTVAALPTALVLGDTATFSRYGTEGIPSGTLVGRTYAERDSNTPFGPANVVSDDEIFLTVFDNPNVRDNADIELCRHGSLVAENYLPGYATLTTGVNEVETVVIGGTATAGSFKLGITRPGGGLVWTDPIAWNATNATIITNIQAALDDSLGAGLVVAADNGGTAANPNFKLTYSGAGYTNLAQPLVSVDISALTGATTATVAHLVPGGTPLLTKIRQIYRCITGAQ